MNQNYSLFARDTQALDLLSFIPAAQEITTEPAAPVKQSPKHFYRCNDCLTVAVTREEIKPTYDQKTGARHYATCDACGGDVEYMGRTQTETGITLVKNEYRCPCDDRCTSARGPNCDCKCGGKNHGSNLVVEVITAVGTLPKLMTPPSARRNAEQFRALYALAMQAWETRYAAVNKMRADRVYMQSAEYSLYCTGQNNRKHIAATKQMKSHSARMRKLGAIIAEIKGVR